jgi:hypothetical protein
LNRARAPQLTKTKKPVTLGLIVTGLDNCLSNRQDQGVTPPHKRCLLILSKQVQEQTWLWADIVDLFCKIQIYLIQNNYSRLAWKPQILSFESGCQSFV